MWRALAVGCAQGFLEKQGGRAARWQKRFFVLRNDILYYFKSDDASAESLGNIPLASVGVEEVQVDGGHKFMFEIKAENLRERRNYRVSARSREDMMGWMNACKAAQLRRLKIVMSQVLQRLDILGFEEGIFRLSGSSARLLWFNHNIEECYDDVVCVCACVRACVRVCVRACARWCRRRRVRLRLGLPARPPALTRTSRACSTYTC